MRPRIISGLYGGRRLFSGKRLPHSCRPSSDRVKETLFNILQEQVEGSIVLDLCSGIGSLGLEAMSRGAKKVIFIEKDAAVVDVLKRNIQTLDPEMDCQLIHGNLPSALRSVHDKVHLIFFDPPYANHGLRDEVLSRLDKEVFLETGCILVLEQDKKSEFRSPPLWSLEKAREVGSTKLHFLKWMKE